MATHHAKSNEVVNLKTWAQDTGTEKNKVVMRTNELEVARLVIPAGKVFKEHKVSGPITVHCIEGFFSINALGVSLYPISRHVLHLILSDTHSLEGIADS
ncbi:MAG: hypothetical protein KDI33_08125, partial [Halioglobus sp.]|nr:hypothetical protein [Halioglobus sp.]